MLNPVEDNRNNEEVEPAQLTNTQPRILDMKVHSVNNKPVFYGYEDEDKAFCVPTKSWEDKPTYLDYFDTRDLESEDLGDIVVNGLLDKSDYQKLKSTGVMDPMLEQLFEKMQELNDKLVTLEAAMEDQKSKQELEKVSDSPVDDNGVIDEGADDGKVQILQELLDIVRGDHTTGSSVLDLIVSAVRGDDIDTQSIRNALAGGSDGNSVSSRKGNKDSKAGGSESSEGSDEQDSEKTEDPK